MQVLSDRLVEALEKYGGKLLMRHTVEHIEVSGGKATSVRIRNQKTGEVWTESADEVVANVTVQNLVKLLENNPETRKLVSLQSYKRRVDKLPPASGAFVIYLGVDQSAIPADCPPHLQFLYDYEEPIGENNSLFVSVSHPGDGRAPEGKATIIASSFTDAAMWWRGSKEDYEALKQQYIEGAIARLGQYFYLKPETIIHQESATPRTFAQYTGRDQGIVGGIGQRIPTFGPFGFATRTPLKHLWLVGDSTHPGEGTAGVSYSALTAVRQIEAYS
jgi:C-3',4' desaturase CrtD